MGVLFVVDGATLRCSQGSEDSKLVATHEPFVFLEGKTVASVDDHLPLMNIKPFGNCEAKKKKEGRTCACAEPETPNPWQPGVQDVPLPSFAPAIVAISLLKCEQGGTITITSPGQSVMQVSGAALQQLIQDFLLAVADEDESVFQELLKGFAKGLGFGSAAELNKWVKEMAEHPEWVKKMLGGKAKALAILAALLDGKDVLEELRKGGTRAAIAKSVGVAVDIAVSGGCIAAVGSAEAAGGITAPLIPITAAGCGIVGAGAGYVAEKVSKPAIEIVEQEAKDFFGGLAQLGRGGIP